MWAAATGFVPGAGTRGEELAKMLDINYLVT